MFPATVERLRCPEDGAPLTIAHPLRADPSGEIVEGVLACAQCARWFRIERGVPDLMRDALREDRDEAAFLERHRAALPTDLVEQGHPVSTRTPPIARSDADRRIVEEGRHWGAFMRRFWDVGDRSIFDIDVRGQHPRFFVAGILERDDRDVRAKWASFTDGAGAALFEDIGHLRGKLAVDVGCGGGQFGLFYATRGIDTIGFDPSFEECALAREHARSRGCTNIEYLRAEPANPPLAKGIFDVLLAKDALHHVPELDRVFEEKLLPLLREDAVAFVHEHVGKASLKGAILRRIAPRLIAKMRRRYPSVPVPEELLRDSANEDVSMARVVPVVRRHFRTERQSAGWWLGPAVEGMVYFAFGKRRWFATLCRIPFEAIEWCARPFQPIEHWSFRGTRRRDEPPP